MDVLVCSFEFAVGRGIVYSSWFSETYNFRKNCIFTFVIKGIDDAYER